MFILIFGGLVVLVGVIFFVLEKYITVKHVIKNEETSFYIQEAKSDILNVLAPMSIILLISIIIGVFSWNIKSVINFATPWTLLLTGYISISGYLPKQISANDIRATALLWIIVIIEVKFGLEIMEIIKWDGF